MDEQQPRPNRVFDALADIEITAEMHGHKSSEGDGRTAADIEREWADQAAEKETTVGTE